MYEYTKFNFPVLIERGEDRYFVAQCPILEGCYTQGKTKEEALENLREVIALILEEGKVREAMRSHSGAKFYFETLKINHPKKIRKEE